MHLAGQGPGKAPQDMLLKPSHENGVRVYQAKTPTLGNVTKTVCCEKRAERVKEKATPTESESRI